ncbi:hypothetical protein F4777DRAFT_574364 [Nemania sp. FL0916]|nr:hypothetical protein F4777DRAFT_574364 [Nemania sp. FL0916]
MPDEEMEMAVDFGQPGFGEDIDIDLDFPAGQPDEDMDLGDFDRVHDFHNFNSDTRDELMAERDDASYGMIDAIETDHHATVAAVNDVDIEIENTIESIWQQDQPLADLNPDTEISYLDEADEAADEAAAENMDAERHEIDNDEWDPVTSSRSADGPNRATGISNDVFTIATETQEEPLLDDLASSHGGPAEPARPSHTDAEVAYPAASGVKHIGQSNDTDNLVGEREVEVEAPALDDSLTAEREAPNVGQPLSETTVNPGSPSLIPHEQQETDGYDEAAQPELDHGDELSASYDFGQLEHPDATETSKADVDYTEPLSTEEANESANDTSGYQLGGESYIETTNDQNGADDAPPQAEPYVRSESQSGEVVIVQAPQDYEDEVATTPRHKSSDGGLGDKDNPVELADLYGIYISYGETDYQLFAVSEDDDPNQYFLTDKSALDLPLNQFLISLREVISEEISPLDDLVLQVDGLGLEFSESTTAEFLEKFTFGDLVILYDKLVKNEQAESSPPIYTSLTVKPNCNRRMMALGESANAGRGLSEVVLYHDSSVDEEQVDGVESPNTDFSTGNNDGETGDISQQGDHQEDDTFDDGQQQNSHSVPSEAPVEYGLDQYEEADELNGDEVNSADGSADEADHEQSASITKQGILPLISQSSSPCTQDSSCWCERCYELELLQLVAPTEAIVLSTPGTVLPTHNSSPPKPSWMTNSIIKDHTTSDSSVSQPQETSDRERQPSPRTFEAIESESHGPKMSNPSADIPNSENTSFTATLDGEDRDEIDYNSDDDKEGNYALDEPIVPEQSSRTPIGSNAAVDDEITWESDDEDQKDSNDGLNPDIVQVSPVSGKRLRSESDALDDAGDENGMTSTDNAKLLANSS